MFPFDDVKRRPGDGFDLLGPVPAAKGKVVASFLVSLIAF